ncbi:hypothetical protein HK098_007948 [Nowakowskiella sp. JEL0407]|nr:hypothetical protein HK098_007948 [Nowakowskiella sp. JEL0407]
MPIIHKDDDSSQTVPVVNIDLFTSQDSVFASPMLVTSKSIQPPPQKDDIILTVEDKLSQPDIKSPILITSHPKSKFEQKNENNESASLLIKTTMSNQSMTDLLKPTWMQRLTLRFPQKELEKDFAKWFFERYIYQWQTKATYLGFLLFVVCIPCLALPQISNT